MNMRVTGSYPAGLTSPVDKRIGDAFPIVEEVYKHLSQLKYLAENSEKFVGKQIEFRANTALGAIEWRYSDQPSWLVLVSYDDLVGKDFSSIEETLNQTINNGLQTITERVDKAVLSYPDYATASAAAAATLPDGQPVEVSQDETRAGARTRYKVQTGALVFVANLDPASATDASLVGFQQAGVGAVSTTVQNKLQESLSVKDFGAVGNGVTNDTAAIQAALNHAAANNLSLHFPAGTYIASGLTYTASYLAHLTISGEGSGNTTLQAPPGTTSPVFTLGVGGSALGPNQMLFHGLSFKGNYPGSYQASAAAYTQHTFLVDTANHILFDDCRFYNGVNGLSVRNGVITHLHRCGAWYNEIGFYVATPGIAIAGTTTFLDKTDAKNNHRWGVYFDDGRMLTMSLCTVEGNGGNGMGSSGGVYVGEYTGGEGGTGFTALGAVIDTTWFEANSGTAAVYLRSGINTLRDCNFSNSPTDPVIKVSGGRYFLERLVFENQKTYHIYESALASVLAGNSIVNCYVGASTNTPAKVFYDVEKTSINFGGGGITLQNEGTGVGLYIGADAGTVLLRSVAAGPNVAVDVVADTLVISASLPEAGAAKVIALIGDSLVSPNPLLPTCAGEVLNQEVRQAGYDGRVVNCGKDGWTFNKARTLPAYNGMTSVDYAISLKPEVVLVALGLNDCINNVEGRTMGQVREDARMVFEELRAALPLAKIIYVSENSHDSTHASGDLLNRQVLPGLMTLPSTGVFSGKVTTDMLTSQVSAATQTAYNQWVNVDTYVRALPSISNFGVMDVWRIHRLGGGGPDRLHLNGAGALLVAGSLLGILRYSGVELASTGYPVWEGPDQLFVTTFVSNGVEWVPSGTLATAHVVDKRLHPSTWYYGYDFTTWITGDVVGGANGVFSWEVSGAPPGKEVFLSVNGGTPTTTNQITDGSGRARAATGGATMANVLGFPPGTYSLRYVVDSLVSPAKTLTMFPAAADDIPAASAEVRGGIKVGAGLAITGDVLRTTPPSPTLYVTRNVPADADGVYLWLISNAAPLTPVEVAVNGGSFSPTGITTDAAGSAISSAGGAQLSAIGFPVGSYTLTFKVGALVFPSKPLVVVAGASSTLPTASATTLGGVKVGAGLAIASGVLSAPVATISVPGLVKPGTGLAVAADGTLNATGTGGVTEEAWQTINLPIGSVYAGSHAPAYRRVGTTVQLRGAWNMGTGWGGVPNNYTLTTLPLGYRPTGIGGIVGMPVAWGGVESGVVIVTANGDLKVSLRAGAPFANPIVFLDGCSFSIN